MSQSSTNDNMVNSDNAEAPRIVNRPRKMAKRQNEPATLTSGYSAHISSQPATQSPLPPSFDPSSEFTFSVPGPLFSEDKGKEKEVQFDVQAHERPLTAKEDMVLRNLSYAQRRHLIEEFRHEIASESRPGHRAEMKAETQTEFDKKLAAEKKKWEEERVKTETWSKNALAVVKEQREKITTMEKNCQKAFSKGEEKGAKRAIGEHAARWTSMDDQLATKKKQLENKQGNLEREKERLEGLERDQTDALRAEKTAHTQDIAAQTQEVERLRREGEAHVEGLRKEGEAHVEGLRKEGEAHVERLKRAGEAHVEKVRREEEEKIKRARAEVESFAGSLQKHLAEESTRIQRQLVMERQDHQDAMRACAQEQARREQTLTHLHDAEMQRLRKEHLDEQYVPPSVSEDDDVSRLTLSLSMFHTTHAKPTSTTTSTTSTTSTKPVAPIETPLSTEIVISTSTKPAIPNKLATARQRRDILRARSRRHLEKKASQMRAQMREGFRDTAAEASEEKRQMGEALAGLKKDLEASQADLGRQVKASQDAHGEIRSLRGEAEEHREERWRSSRDNRQLRNSLSKKEVDLQTSIRHANLSASLERRARRDAGELREGLGELVQEKKAAEAEAGSLSAAYGELGAEKERIEAKYRSTASRLKEAERKVKEAETGGREMDAPLGVPEKAFFGLLWPQFPRWKEWVFWLLVGLLLGLLVVSRAASSAANRDQKLWLEVTRRAGERAKWLGQDPMLDIARGMYGV